MKKNAKSPLVNPQAYGTLQNSKKVDEDLYRKEGPTVDICEDRREENFRIDINSWTLNKHGQQVLRGDPAGANTVNVQIESAGSDIQLNPASPQWTLHDHQKVKTVKSKQGHPRVHHRLNSIISVGSENLGYIPENETLSLQPAGADISTLPTTADNLHDESTSTSDSAKELVLDLSSLDVSLSTDQFSYRKSSRTKNFYEAFGTPRSQDINDGFDTTDSGSSPLQDVHIPLRYSYPNISLPPTDSPPTSSRSSNLAASTSNIRKYTKRTDNPPVNAAQLFSQSLPTAMTYGSEYDMWNTKRSSDVTPMSRRISKMRSGNSRVSYLTQLKLGETVRLQQEKKKRKRFDPKGTIHYAYKSDVSLAKS